MLQTEEVSSHCTLCYGGILCKITSGDPVESPPLLLTLAKHSKPVHEMAVLKMRLKNTQVLHRVVGDRANYSHLIIFPCELIS